jgi:outer membrane receptor protein involved in Fe transport
MREGFATVTETMSVGPDASRVSIRLEPAGLVENVTVSGSALRYRVTEAEASTRFDAPLLEQPQSVQVVTRGIIEERQLQRLNEVAYQASGVQPISGYGGVRSTGYIVRGFRQYLALGSFRNGFREDTTIYFALRASLVICATIWLYLSLMPATPVMTASAFGWAGISAFSTSIIPLSMAT